MNVKIIITLALMFICLNEAAAQGRRGGGGPGGRRGGGGPGRGKPKPCDRRDNLSECTCEDRETYDSPRDIRRNCRPDENPIVSCACNDETTWTPDDTTWTPPEKPCGGRENLDECTCEDGETYSGRDVKRNCKRDDNPIVSCDCKDGTTWAPSK